MRFALGNMTFYRGHYIVRELEGWMVYHPSGRLMAGPFASRRLAIAKVDLVLLAQRNPKEIGRVLYRDTYRGLPVHVVVPHKYGYGQTDRYVVYGVHGRPISPEFLYESQARRWIDDFFSRFKNPHRNPQYIFSESYSGLPIFKVHGGWFAGGRIDAWAVRDMSGKYWGNFSSKGAARHWIDRYIAEITAKAMRGR